MGSPDGNPFLAAALEYAGLGWRVVPCKDRDKAPRIKNWVNEASTDEAAIAAWWTQWPQANVGVALGTGSGIVAVDIDSEAGEQMLREWAGGKPEATLEITTGKGRRLIYAIPDTLDVEPEQRADFKDPGGVEAVRLQARGGQCVMPPSIHPTGKTYAWARNFDPSTLGDPTPMPAWLIALMCRPAAEPNEKPSEPKWADSAAAGAFAEGGTFNERGDWWRDILDPAGFTQAGQDERGVLRFKRPGKHEEGHSVTVGHYRARDGSPALYVFSGSIPQLRAGHCYDKFGAYARLFHAGDFARAAQELARQGYSRPRNQASRGGPNPGPAGGNSPPAEPAEWGDPIPLDDASPRLPAFPVAVLPRALQDLVAGSAAVVGCPVDYPATHALGVAAGAIGGSYDLQIKRGFDAPSNLWICVVAPPGSGKSPGVAPVLSPVYAEHARRVLAGDADKSPAFISDVTVERLARQLHDAPRGLLMVWDEMAGWLTSFNQYKAGGKGNDRAHYLSIWDGRALRVDRAGQDKPAIFVRRPRLSVVGGIQPEVLDELRAGPSDGLFDRLLVSYPPDPGLVVEQFVELDQRPRDAWAEALGRLWGVRLKDDNGDKRPHRILLNFDARDCWQSWTQELASRAKDPDAPSYFRAIAAKISGYAARLALVVHRLREVYEELPGEGVNADGMERGVELARYFLGHADRVRRAAGRDERLARMRALSRWAGGREEATFTRSDAWQSMRKNAAFTKLEDLDEPLRLLRGYRHVRWNKALDRYETNPALRGEAGRSSDSEKER